MKIGLLGFGVVGRGVYDLVADRDDIQVAKVLCLEDITLPDAEVTKDFNSILNDETIDTVVEAMGGLHPAYDFVRAAMEAGKNIVTSNKALVASFYDELIPLAMEKGLEMSVFFQKALIQATAVNANPDWNITLLANIHHSLHTVLTADIAGVNANLGRSALCCGNRKPIVKVDIRNQRQRRLRTNLAKGFCRLHIGNSKPCHLAACRGKLTYRRKRRFYIRCRRIEHGLDYDRISSADPNISNSYYPGHKIHPLIIINISLNIIKAISISRITSPAPWI